MQTVQQPGKRVFRRMWSALLALMLAPACLAADLVAIPQLGLSVARGFRVTQVADAAMVHDIRSLAFTPGGEIAVSGPGYIRILHDANNDGIADGSTLFATTDTGASGMCFDGDTLYCVSDGLFWRYYDSDDDGMADSPPENLFPVPSGEAGARAVRKGPDGNLYLATGHDSALLRGQLTGERWRGKPEAGMILRAGPEGENPVVLAHGFHNPAGLDFNWMGDLFTADSSEDADVQLPWYAPARLFHVAPLGHHGWRVDHRGKPWPLPEYSADVVESAASLDRALPAALVCYRHVQFPAVFQDGLFICDWAHGQVLFTGLDENGSSYAGTPEIFVSAIGASGFTPIAAAVGPDGSLFVATGGRRTHGAVYRIQFGGAVDAALNWRLNAITDLARVLGAPQPLDAWSRDEWIPLARRLGPEIFASAAADQRLAPGDRVRAIEVLTELFGGLIPQLAAATAAAEANAVRERTAWSLGVHLPANGIPLLLSLARDPIATVRRAAMEALQERADDLDADAWRAAVASNLPLPDKRLHQPAARLAAGMPDSAWSVFWEQSRNAPIDTRLGAILAQAWRQRGTGLNRDGLDAALRVLAQSRNRDEQLDATRLAVLALGDWKLTGAGNSPLAEFEATTSPTGDAALSAAIEGAALNRFPSGNVRLDRELSRLLAMIGSTNAEAQARILSRCTAQSDAADDFHHLTALSCLAAPGLERLAAPLAAALLAMDRKQGGLEDHALNWPLRFTEVTERLLNRAPGLRAALLRQRDFARPAHLGVVDLLGADLQSAAARAYLVAARSDRQFPGSDALINLLATLPPQETAAWFRQQWSNAGLRDRLLLEFAARPTAADTDKFANGLLSPQPETVRACVTALQQLPAQPEAQTIVPAMRLLRRLMFQPAEKTMRASTLALINHLSGRQFKVNETGTDPNTLRNSYAPVFLWFVNTHPALVRQLDADDGGDPAQWLLRVRSVDWNRGDAARGEAIYGSRGCGLCHDGAEPLGPSLSAAAARMNAADLMLSILFPSRQVEPRWRTTLFRMSDGNRFGGLVIYEGSGVVMVQTGATTNVRLSAGAIMDRWPGTASLMPPGLLNNISQQGLADLNAFLQELRNAPVN